MFDTTIERTKSSLSYLILVVNANVCSAREHFSGHFTITGQTEPIY